MSNHTEQVLDATVCWPLGTLGIVMHGERVCRIHFLGAGQAPVRPRTAAARRVVEALREYLRKPEHSADIPLELQGTPFQQKVWHALQQLSPGQTISYGELAKQLGSGARAVGNACRHNPVPVLVPCHRVVSKQSAGGFAGKQTGPLMATKLWLLAHEGVEKYAGHPH